MRSHRTAYRIRDWSAASRSTSAPVWYDTRKAGRANRGHRYGETLNPDEQRALIEFLKRL